MAAVTERPVPRQAAATEGGLTTLETDLAVATYHLECAGEPVRASGLQGHHEPRSADTIAGLHAALEYVTGVHETDPGVATVAEWGVARRPAAAQGDANVAGDP